MQQRARDVSFEDRGAAHDAVALPARRRFDVGIDERPVHVQFADGLDAVGFACRTHVRIDDAAVFHQDLAAQADRAAAFHLRRVDRHVDNAAVHHERVILLRADDAVEVHGERLFRLVRVQVDVQIAVFQIDRTVRSLQRDAVHHGEVFALREPSGITVAIDADTGVVLRIK